MKIAVARLNGVAIASANAQVITEPKIKIYITAVGNTRDEAKTVTDKISDDMEKILKEDSENDAKEMGRSCYSHSIGCAYGGNNTYGFA